MSKKTAADWKKKKKNRASGFRRRKISEMGKQKIRKNLQIPVWVYK